jgi:HK97 family phage prohead protease
VRALFNHQPDWLLGRTTSGTLRMHEDEQGLAVEIDCPDTQLCRDMVLTPMERGDLTQMSFAFTVGNGGTVWEEQDGIYIRNITKFAQLFDVSPVTYPAYPETDVGLRELRAHQGERKPAPLDAAALRDLERRVRAAQLTL